MIGKFIVFHLCSRVRSEYAAQSTAEKQCEQYNYVVSAVAAFGTLQLFRSKAGLHKYDTTCSVAQRLHKQRRAKLEAFDPLVAQC